MQFINEKNITNSYIILELPRIIFGVSCFYQEVCFIFAEDFKSSVMKPIVLQHKYANKLIEVLKAEKLALLEEIQSLTSELEAIDNQLSDLAKSIKGETGVITLRTAEPTEYSNDFSWGQKVYFVLRELKTPVILSVIVDRILKYEPELDRKKVVSSVSSYLSIKTKEANSLFTKDVRDDKNTYFGLLEWNEGGLM